MIYLRLAGGLGNQLFQLACALKYRATAQEPILLTTNALSGYKTPRRPDVQTVMDLATLNVEAGRCDGLLVSAALAMRLPRMVPFIGISDRNFDPIEADRRSRASLLPLLGDGYFQTKWRWESLSDVLGIMTAATVSPLPAKTPATRCLIHVRGTDFLGSSAHAVIGPDYYVRALDKLRACQMVDQVAVITDDPDYARSFLQSAQRAHPDLQFSLPDQPASILQDFLALRDAGARIIPNSTFSWWAAALDGRRGTTISPDVFVKNAVRQPALPWEQCIPGA